MKSLSSAELIGQLLAQAEAAGTEEERQAFYEAAQRKATRLGIDQAKARAAIAKISEREKPTHKRFTLGPKGQKALAHYCELFMNIASVNDLRCTMAHNSTYINLYGMPSDIEVAEALYNSCIVAMVREGDDYVRNGDYKNKPEMLWKRWREPNPDYPEDGYSYGTPKWAQEPKYIYHEGYKNVPISGMTARQNFYAGFVREIYRRLTAAKSEARSQAIAEDREEATEATAVEPAVTSTELVLKEKALEVHDFYEEATRGRVSRRGYRGASTAVHSSAARGAGRAAGSNVDLGGRKALPGPRTQIGG